MPQTNASYGEIGFETYGDEGKPVPWKTFDGRPMPHWNELEQQPHGAETRRRWEAAAQAILRAYCAREGLPPPKL